MSQVYWFRTGNPADLIPWLAITFIWLVGGWLIASHAFNLERRERFMIGLGLGLVPYLWFSNLLGHWIPPALAFILASLLVLLIGIYFAWRDGQPYLDWKDLAIWPQLIAGILLVFVFSRIAAGVPFFDDHKNLSIISTMASGDIPPHFHMNSGFYFSYHYGFQLLGASLMRLGGLFPWSAFDFSKALVGAYHILLAYLLSMRYVKNEFKAALITIIFTFAFGTRYLLVLLPHSVQITLLLEQEIPGVFTPLSELLTHLVFGSKDDPFPIPFVFRNGIVSWPRFVGVQAGPSTMGFITLFLIWMLVSRGKHRFSFFIFLVIFSFWGMSWEATYALFLVGGVLVLGIKMIQREKLRLLDPALLALLFSLPVTLVQGGTLTEIFRKLIWGSTIKSLVPAGNTIAGFSIRWPPAIPSTEFAPHSLFSPAQLFVALNEMGPVILLAPWITVWAWRRFQKGDWPLGALAMGAWVGFLGPIFFHYQIDRDITRLTAFAVMIWTIFLAILVWEWVDENKKTFAYASTAILGLMAFGGVIVAGFVLTAATRTILSYPTNLAPLDALVSRATWDRLPQSSEVFDSKMWRATALTGRLNRSAIKTNVPSPEWEALLENPSASALLADGYSYVYIDETWWSELSSAQQSSLTPECSRIVTEQREKDEFRRLVDLTGCSSP